MRFLVVVLALCAVATAAVADDDTSVISRLSRASLNRRNKTDVATLLGGGVEAALAEDVDSTEAGGSSVDIARGFGSTNSSVGQISGDARRLNLTGETGVRDSEKTLDVVTQTNSSDTPVSRHAKSLNLDSVATESISFTTSKPENSKSSDVSSVVVEAKTSSTPKNDVAKSSNLVVVSEPKLSPPPTRESAKSSTVDTEVPEPVNLLRDGLLPVLESMILSPISIDVPGERCRNHSKIFERELSNFKLWAVQMLDASSKFPSGVLSGSTYQLGHFDECLGVSVALPSNQGQLSGQYCLPEVEFSPLEPRPTARIGDHWATPDFNTSAWVKIKSEKLDRRIRRRDVIHWAMCIPASCSSEDLQLSMDHALQRMAAILKTKVTVRVDPALCQVQTDLFSRLTLGDFVFGSVVLVFVLLVAAGTLHDLVRAKQHKSRDARHGKLLQCFSAKATLSNWVRVDPDKDMIPLHAVRFGCMIGILMGHHFIADSNSPLLNSEFLEQATNNPFALPLLVVPALVVDSFFLVSGFLTTRFILIDLDKNRLKVFSGYMHRFLRLTPVYMLMVAYHATLLGKIGSGPLWPTRLARDQYRCSKNWWTNLLYVNNYVNTDELCLFQSWHVACDLHFSLIAPILVVCLWRRPRTGVVIITFLGAAIITALYVITWLWDLDPILMSFLNVMSDLSADPTFRLQYIPTHTRGIPYLFGIVAAYMHFKNPMQKKQLSQKTVLLAWAMTFLLMTSPMVTAVVFYSPTYSPSSWMSALYASLHRIPWCLGQAWLIVVAITGNAGFLQKVLDFKLLVPMSRLSYCVFLVHNAVQLFMGASVRSPQYLGPPTILWMMMGDIVVTYAIALGVHIMFEAPIQRLDKTFFTKADSKRVDPNKFPATITDSNGNGWRQNMAFEKGSDDSIAKVYHGSLVSTVLTSELR